jgi:hypothetical protein
MSKGGASTTTESDTRLSEELRGSAVGALRDAENLYNLGTEGIYQGTRLAEEDPLLAQAQEERLSRFAEGGDLAGVLGSGLSSFQNYLGAGDLANNPVFQQQMENILGEASTQFSRGAVPIMQQASAAGQYGGSEGMEGLGLLGGEIDRNTQAALVQSALGQQQLGLQAQQLLPQVLRTSMMGADVAEGIGKQRSLRSQAELLDEIQMAEADRNAQLQNLSQFYQMLQGSPLVAEASQISTETQETADDPFSALLGTAMTVMGMPTAGGSIGGDIFGSLFGGGETVGANLSPSTMELGGGAEDVVARDFSFN